MRLLTEMIYLKHLAVTYRGWLYATIIILWPLFSSIFLAFLLSVSSSFKILVSSRLHLLSQLETLFFLIWLKLSIYMLTSLNLCAFKTFFCTWNSKKKFYVILAYNWKRKGSDSVISCNLRVKTKTWNYNSASVA